MKNLCDIINIKKKLVIRPIKIALGIIFNRKISASLFYAIELFLSIVETIDNKHILHII